MSRLHTVAGFGQSVWLDDVSRSALDSGQFQRRIEQGVRGVTSNPTIFDQAISGSADYDAALRRGAREGLTPEEIYERLALEDIGRAADLLLPVYRRSGGADGFASLEVSPRLAHDTAGTVAAARRLFARLDRPNVMIKVPATAAGMPAVARLIGEGIHVNVTLIFSITQYEAAAEAYLTGLETLAARGGDLGRVASVASFFVSRVDTAVDAALEETGHRELRGHLAVDNARLAYARFLELFRGERWERLAAAGARVQRPLWASTGTKNQDYPDTLYVDSLIGPHTVNTAPPKTLDAFLDHGAPRPMLTADLDGARRRLAALGAAGVDLAAVTARLLDEGVAAFTRSYHSLLTSIEEQRVQMLAADTPVTGALGTLAEPVRKAEGEAAADRVAERIGNRDHTLWRPDPAEIANRLGWLDLPGDMAREMERLRAFAAGVRTEGFTHAVVLGMGGSSLAPEVFSRVFGVLPGALGPASEDRLELSILDTSDPGAVLAFARRQAPERTLYLVATKSGTTVEPLSLFRFFQRQATEALGVDAARRHFAAITDPGSPLVKLAQDHGFREIFLANPDVGGRYAALTHFGLVPAALAGVDLPLLLERAGHLAERCREAADNPGVRLGATLAEAAAAGRDKVTFVCSAPLAPFADWAEQLLAESTGKDGRGLVPVVGEPLGRPEAYGDDRLFVNLRLGADPTHEAALEALRAAGHPVVRLTLADRYDLGAQFFLWEFAAAVAGRRLGIQPFDQPDVEAAKILAREKLAAYQRDGVLPEPAPALRDGALSVYGPEVRGASVAEALDAFLCRGGPHAYLAIQAYLPASPDREDVLRALQAALRDRTQQAITLGYGPRFLHSTGQLHKGGPATGLFLQLTADPPEDAVIPGDGDDRGQTTAVTFGVLQRAQALGDAQALMDQGRPVLRIHLGSGGPEELRRLLQGLA